MPSVVFARRIVWLLVASIPAMACSEASESTGEQGDTGTSADDDHGTASTSDGADATGSGSATGTITGSSSTGGNGDSTEYAEPDAIVGGPCEDGSTSATPPCSSTPEQVYCRLDDPTDVIMAVCHGVGRSQCEVMDDCEPGWHACTATDYVARGGRDVPPAFSSNTDRAWLAACVQDLGDSRFRNEPCSFCGDTQYEPVVQWWCDGEVVYEGGMAGTTLGVLAAPECMRVGDNLPQNGAYWSATFTTSGPNLVMCCLDAL